MATGAGMGRSGTRMMRVIRKAKAASLGEACSRLAGPASAARGSCGPAPRVVVAPAAEEAPRSGGVGGGSRRRAGGSSGGGAAGMLLAVSAMSLTGQVSCFSTHAAARHGPLILRPVRHAVSTRSPLRLPAVGRSFALRQSGTEAGSAFGGMRFMASSASTEAQTNLGEMEALVPFERGTPEFAMCEELLLAMACDDATLASGLEQGTQEWLTARKYRITGSNFGAAVGRNPFQSPQQLAQEMLVPTFVSNDATRWGNKMEGTARDYYVEQQRGALSIERGVDVSEVDFSVTESGLHIWGKLPIIAASPDGHVNEYGDFGLLEIKCPFSGKMMATIPEYYIDQVQGLMAVLGYRWADFVVWTEGEKTIRRIPFDEEYWEGSLLPGIKSFYRDVFLPAYVKHQLSNDSSRTTNASASANANANAVGGKGSKPLPDSTSARATTTKARAVGERGGGAKKAPQEAAGNDKPAPRMIPPPGVDAYISLTPLERSEVAPASFSGEGSGMPRPSGMVSEIMPSVLELDVALRAKGRRPQFVGSGLDSLFLAVAEQLGQLDVRIPGGDGEVRVVEGCLVRPGDAKAVKAGVLKHIEDNVAFFAKESGQDEGALRTRVKHVKADRTSPGAVEIMASAQLYGVKIVCMVIGTSVSERVFGVGLDSATAVICTTGTFFWSTAKRPEGPTFPHVKEERGAGTGHVMSKGGGGGEGATIESGQLSGQSQFSADFQECICNHAQALMDEGMNDMDALRGAFQHCDKEYEGKVTGGSTDKTPEEVSAINERYKALLQRIQPLIQESSDDAKKR